MKKIIITQRIIDTLEYVEKRDALDVRWAAVFTKLNFLPIIIPSNFDCNAYFSELELDGIILTGGNDISTVSNDENSLIRDELEKNLLTLAVKNNVPIMGICRGMQLMTEHFGGTIANKQGHVGGKHKILIDKGSIYHKELMDMNEVNSFHNYAVTKVPQNFVASAKCEDGTIEAMENTQQKILGIMWHPERNAPLKEADLNLMKRFFND